MENLLCIKGKIIGKGKPLVCVPVMESSKEEILRETRRLEEAHTEMIESVSYTHLDVYKRQFLRWYS